MEGTIALAVAMLGLWWIGSTEHTPNPTWQQLWTLLIAWVVLDVVNLLVEARYGDDIYGLGRKGVRRLWPGSPPVVKDD